MAEIQDLESEVSEIEAVEAKDEQAAVVEQKAEDIIPEEFRGMSVAELARIAAHARKEMGRQGNELGEIRKLADGHRSSVVQCLGIFCAVIGRNLNGLSGRQARFHVQRQLAMKCKSSERIRAGNNRYPSAI